MDLVGGGVDPPKILRATYMIGLISRVTGKFNPRVKSVRLINRGFLHVTYTEEQISPVNQAGFCGFAEFASTFLNLCA
jgi:hypothetical protein